MMARNVSNSSQGKKMQGFPEEFSFPAQSHDEATRQQCRGSSCKSICKRILQVIYDLIFSCSYEFCIGKLGFSR